MALDRQINLFKVDTNAFLTEQEEQKRKYLVKLKKVRNKVYKKVDGRERDMNKTYKKYKKIYDQDCERHGKLYTSECKLSKYNWYFIKITDLIKEEEPIWKEFILQSAKEAVEYNDANSNDKHIRQLNERYLSYIDKETKERKINLSNVIAMFESTLSRSFDIKQNELTYDIFVLEIYYYDIAKDLIINGFDYSGKHYVYFSSSAGQIRTKKAVFVEEEKYKKCQKKLTCGLTIEDINKHGGMNINKYLAYLALANSATDLWEDVFGEMFDIDRCIVVDDFETMVSCKVDNIDYNTYKITPGVEMEIPIPHTDGCGIIDSNYCNKNFMVRLPFIKGLLGSFDFKRFCESNKCNGDVIDIWGKKHNIYDENIYIIFTKSQLKMYKYYDSWEQYKEYFKEYSCEAGICNMEEDKIPNAKINYQMLQTLYDATDEEIFELCRIPNKKIKEISSSLENALSFFGVNLEYQNEDKKDWFQKALRIYPDLLVDPATRQDLHDLKNSYIKKYRGGHLDVKGKFTFVLPDLYAFCEWLFCGEEIPYGLLNNNEVYCRLYGERDLDCLRSPHLYIEHAIRKNVVNKEINNNKLSDWFVTDAIYTSTHDPISRILQFDVDGDRLLVVAQETIVNMAKRVMDDVYPLYYEMKKANAEEINSHNIYKGLELAFTGGRIGPISNDITKIWNSGEITEEARNAVRWLCMETNFTIDYAKTLFKPTRPSDVDEILKKYGRQKVPYFFQYAKDKRYDEDYSDSQCEKRNESMLNRITKEIKDNRCLFKPMSGLKPVDYKLLLSDKYEYNEEVVKTFDKLNKKYGNMNFLDQDDNSRSNITQVNDYVLNEIEKVESDTQVVIYTLVKSLYEKPTTRKKKLLWYIYGEQMYENLLKNVGERQICKQCGEIATHKSVFDKTHMCVHCGRHERKKGKNKLVISCIDCGEDVIIGNTDMKTCRCEECKKIYKNKYQAELMQQRRNKKC